MKIALLVSILLQITAAGVALGLTRKTKYNISWVFLSIAFLLMAIRRIIDLIPVYFKELETEMSLIDRILGIVTSVFLLAGVVLIQQLFRYLKRIEDVRFESENKVLQAVMETEERERRQLAKDLHDGLGPLLSNIKMSVSAIDKSTINGFNNDIINNIHTLINESIISLKETSNNLSPHTLESSGLASALNSFIEKINALGGLDISFSNNIENIRFETQTEINIYRVICELFNNTFKHARAEKVSLLIHYSDNRLVAQYFDDGIGFDADSLVNETGMGISNMRSRLKTINGTIEFKRIKPQGMMTNILLKTIPNANNHGKS
ncbi:MAG: sensor histidine kinase [Bacteroidales bacterium]|nr:sensor histidine kinase [Bacteroidales bacterium]